MGYEPIKPVVNEGEGACLRGLGWTDDDMFLYPPLPDLPSDADSINIPPLVT